jgi:hypothetical protein
MNSLRLLVAREPTWIGLPHFGAVPDPMQHLDAATEAVRRHAELGRSLDCDAYVRTVRDELSATLDADAVRCEELTVDLAQNHAGLRRWVEQTG